MVRRLIGLSVGGTPRSVLVPYAPSAPTLAKPGMSSTGVAGDYSGLTPSAGMTVSTNDAVFEGLDILGAVAIRAHGVTFRGCRIRPIQDSAPSYPITWGTVASTGTRPTGLVFEDVEIDGNGREGDAAGPFPSGWGQSAAIQPGIDFSVIRCNVHSSVDGIKPQDNPVGTSILIEDSWVHSLATAYGSDGLITHNDVLHIAGTGAQNVTIRRNNLDGYRPGDPNIESRYASSSLMQWGSFPGSAGVLANILIEDNWIDGGGFASRLSYMSAASVTNVLLRRNRFGLRHRYGVFQDTGNLAQDGGFPVLENNVWDATGTADYGASAVAGQLVDY